MCDAEKYIRSGPQCPYLTNVDGKRHFAKLLISADGHERILFIGLVGRLKLLTTEFRRVLALVPSAELKRTERG